MRAPETSPRLAAASATTPEDAFAHAKSLMDGGDYDGAEAAFAAFVRRYPDSPKTAEGNYWWGKTLSVRNANAKMIHRHHHYRKPIHRHHRMHKHR